MNNQHKNNNPYVGTFAEWIRDPDVWIGCTETEAYYTADDRLEKIKNELASSSEPISKKDIERLLEAQRELHRLEMEYLFKYGIWGMPFLPSHDRYTEALRTTEEFEKCLHEHPLCNTWTPQLAVMVEKVERAYQENCTDDFEDALHSLGRLIEDIQREVNNPL